MSRRPAWSYDGCTRGERFDSEAWGEQQALPNGNVPITESYAGRVFEVNRAGEIVWSWVNHIGEQGGKPVGGVVGPSHRYPPGSLPFVERAGAPAGLDQTTLPRG